MATGAATFDCHVELPIDRDDPSEEDPMAYLNAQREKLAALANMQAVAEMQTTLASHVQARMDSIDQLMDGDGGGVATEGGGGGGSIEISGGGSARTQALKPLTPRGMAVAEGAYARLCKTCFDIPCKCESEQGSATCTPSAPPLPAMTPREDEASSAFVAASAPADAAIPAVMPPDKPQHGGWVVADPTVSSAPRGRPPVDPAVGAQAAQADIEMRRRTARLAVDELRRQLELDKQAALSRQSQDYAEKLAMQEAAANAERARLRQRLLKMEEERDSLARSLEAAEKAAGRSSKFREALQGAKLEGRESPSSSTHPGDAAGNKERQQQQQNKKVVAEDEAADEVEEEEGLEATMTEEEFIRTEKEAAKEKAAVAAARENEALRAEVNDLKEKCEAQSFRLSEALTMLAGAQDKAERLSAANEKATRELQLLEEQQVLRETDADEAARRSDVAWNALRRLRVVLEMTTGNAKEGVGKLDSKIQAIAGLRSKLQEADEDRTRIEREHAATSEMMSRVEKEMKRVEKKLDEHHSCGSNTFREDGSVNREHVTEKQQLSARFEKTMGKAEQCRDKLGALVKALADLEDGRYGVEEELKAAQDSLSVGLLKQREEAVRLVVEATEAATAP